MRLTDALKRYVPLSMKLSQAFAFIYDAKIMAARSDSAQNYLDVYAESVLDWLAWRSSMAMVWFGHSNRTLV